MDENTHNCTFSFRFSEKLVWICGLMETSWWQSTCYTLSAAPYLLDAQITFVYSLSFLLVTFDGTKMKQYQHSPRSYMSAHTCKFHKSFEPETRDRVKAVSYRNAITCRMIDDILTLWLKSRWPVAPAVPSCRQNTKGTMGSAEISIGMQRWHLRHKKDQ